MAQRGAVCASVRTVNIQLRVNTRRKARVRTEKRGRVARILDAEIGLRLTQLDRFPPHLCPPLLSSSLPVKTRDVPALCPAWAYDRDGSVPVLSVEQAEKATGHQHGVGGAQRREHGKGCGLTAGPVHIWGSQWMLPAGSRDLKEVSKLGTGRGWGGVDVGGKEVKAETGIKARK